MRFIEAFVASALLASIATAQARISAQEFAAVRPLLSGTRAKETVAYLDQFVRWPGNPGFDSSIAHVAARLGAAGYVEQSAAKPTDRLTYRIERYPMTNAAWMPIDASLELAACGPNAGYRPRPGYPAILRFATNRNMVATNSFSAPGAGVNEEVVRVAAITAAALDSAHVQGRISSIPFDSSKKAWGVILSFDARRRLLDAMKDGPIRVFVKINTQFTSPATELAIVAEVRGSSRPDECFVYSAHVQEPGANDDASGVGALTEMARTLAELVKAGRVDPKRTMTMLWGQEIRVTDRCLKQDTTRLKGVRWGISLDMVGEDTQKTGGTFLIEKMPDPSAIWTRGNDKHTEWGGRPLDESAMQPHYFNDFLLARCLEQSAATGWVVKTNPFEGGSDHTAYLNNGKPGVLFWHFTDQFYHTDGDRIEMVSPSTLQNAGISALVSGLVLASADGTKARAIIAELQRAAVTRLDAESTLGKEAIAKGGDQVKERHIIDVWGKWYADAIRSTSEIETGGSSEQTRAAIDAAVKAVDVRAKSLARGLTAE